LQYFFGLWFFNYQTNQQKYALIIILISIIYGFFLLSIINLYCVTGRGFDVWDGVADGLGALGGLGGNQAW
jgi:hypothetical protein